MDLPDNMLVGIVEKVADDAGMPRPAWAQGVRPLEVPWQWLGTPRIRVAYAATAPRQPAARNVLVPTVSLGR
jgi:hypothetical protein